LPFVDLAAKYDKRYSGPEFPLAVLATSTGLSAQMEAGPRRPVNVPAEYVVTPFGYFHPSCVQSIAKDDALLPNGLKPQLFAVITDGL
jgi:hypothetical protein